MEPFYSYKQYLIDKFGDKTYKLPVHIPVTCPNRDGTVGYGGCFFCSEQGTGFESLDSMTPVKEQLESAKVKVVKRYKAKKFIAYFQNYTNTYLPYAVLEQFMIEAVECGVVGIDLATRPDCLTKEYVANVKDFARRHGVEITFEIGLQIANDRVLKAINRGHTVKDYVDCVRFLKANGFHICTHLILNLPDTTMEDVKATVELMNILEMDIVKLHSLYIAKDSVYAKMYEEGSIRISSEDEYIKRVVYFIRQLNDRTAISRVVSRIPEEDSDFSNWDKSWWSIYNEIVRRLSDDSDEAIH